MELSSGRIIDIHSIAGRVALADRTPPSLPRDISQKVAASNIRISSTVKVQGAQQDDVLRGVTMMNHLFEIQPEIFGREIDDKWNFARPGNWRCLPDDQMTVHFRWLIDRDPAIPPIYGNYANRSTLKYLKDPESLFYEFVQNRPFSGISMHLGFSVEEFDVYGEDGHSTPKKAGDVLKEEVVAKRILAGIGFVQDNLSARGFAGNFMVENLDFHDHQNGSAYKYVTDPRFISSILSKTSAGLLLDVAHLLISARNLGYRQVVDYAKDILTGNEDRLCEVHMSFPDMKNGVLLDYHRSMYDNLTLPQAADSISALEFILRNRDASRPLIINLETPVMGSHLDAYTLALLLDQLLE